MSEKNNFDSRYLGVRHEGTPSIPDPNSGNDFDEQPTPAHAETSPAAGNPDPDATSVLGRAEMQAALRRAADPSAGPRRQVPLPEHLWPSADGGRRGYDAEPGSDRITDRSANAGAGHAGAPAPKLNDSNGTMAPGVGAYGPGGPPAHNRPGPAHSRQIDRDVPPQGTVPSMPNYPPQQPPDGGARPIYPPTPPLSPYPAAPDNPRQRPLMPDDQRDVSVGRIRAQIRESKVAPPYKPVPEMGWRKGVHRISRINLGLSADERQWNDLRRRLKVNLRGTYVIAVMNVKGGTAKTTASICLGASLKKYRDDKIVAVDSNPASGNLSDRIDEPSTMSWRGLNNDPHLREYTDFRSYLGKDSSSGLEVLGSDDGDQMLTGPELLNALNRLRVQYPITILDCGNQMRDDVMHAILHNVVQAVVVPSTSRLDGAQGAARTLNWLSEHGFPHLVRSAVVLVSNVNNVDASDQVRDLHEDFARTVRAVHDMPFDRHLSDAVAIDFERLRPATRKAYIKAAASLVDGFASAADRESGDPRWPGRGGQA